MAAGVLGRLARGLRLGPATYIPRGVQDDAGFVLWSLCLRWQQPRMGRPGVCMLAAATRGNKLDGQSHDVYLGMSPAPLRVTCWGVGESGWLGQFGLQKLTAESVRTGQPDAMAILQH